LLIKTLDFPHLKKVAKKISLSRPFSGLFCLLWFPHFFKPCFYTVFTVYLIVFSFNNLLLSINYCIYLYFNGFYVVFRLLWQEVKNSSKFPKLEGKNGVKLGFFGSFGFFGFGFW